MNVFAVMPGSNDFSVPSDLQGISFASYALTQIERIDFVCKHIKKSISPVDKDKGQLTEKSKTETRTISTSEWNVFLSCSRKDKSFKDELNHHLAQLRRSKKSKRGMTMKFYPDKNGKGKSLIVCKMQI